MTISVSGVSKRFKDFRALDDVSIEIEDGSLTSILGPSGSGKSTLLRVISGLEHPDSGQVFIFGHDMTKLPPQERGVGFVFQHYAAFKHMTVRENIAFGLKIRKRPKREIQTRVDELIDLVQLNGFADRYPGQLSGGQRQRMGLARALAVEPKVMLLDEPFGALDARVRQELRSWLRRLHDEVHVTTILVTHDQEESMEISDKVIVMNHGRVEQEGSPQKLYDEPVNAFVMSFLGHANRVGEALVRPHDLGISLEPGAGRIEAVVKRLVFLGFEVRAEVALTPDEVIRVQLTRQEADRLALAPDQVVYLDLKDSRTFSEVKEIVAA
jgi:sulfate/thiosulfate transport system ATP-binding protein